MEMLSWFRLSSDGLLFCRSVDPEAALFFLGKLPHTIQRLTTLENQEEVNQLWENEQPLLQTKNHYTVSMFMELSSKSTVVELDILLEGGGQITYSYGTLYVESENLNQLTSSAKTLLTNYGYYAPDQIIKFCQEHFIEFYLPFILGKYPEDITDEFDRMLEHSRQLDSEEMGA